MADFTPIFFRLGKRGKGFSKTVGFTDMYNLLSGRGVSKMSAVIIPVNRLSPEILQSVIEEFATRDGTDYAMTEATLETKIGQVKCQLEIGDTVLLFDQETQTCNIFFGDDPVVRGLVDNQGGKTGTLLSFKKMLR